MSNANKNIEDKLIIAMKINIYITMYTSPNNKCRAY